MHKLTFQKTLEMKNHYQMLPKCIFTVPSVDHVDHIISGVVVDLAKILGMLQWPIPQNVKQLKGFLGLIGYYASLSVIMAL